MLWLSRILTDYDLDDALLLFVIDAYIILDDFVFVFKVVIIIQNHASWEYPFTKCNKLL